MTYQKANNIVKEYLVEDSNRINHLKFKIEEKFNLIHYIYSLLFSKIYNKTNTFGIKRKNNFDFNFLLWKKKKIQNSVKNFNSSLKVDFLAKNPSNYENREVEKHDQRPVETSMNNKSLAMVYSITHDGNGITLKKQTEKRKLLEKRLEENTMKMKRIKKTNKL